MENGSGVASRQIVRQMKELSPEQYARLSVLYDIALVQTVDGLPDFFETVSETDPDIIGPVALLGVVVELAFPPTRVG